VISHDAWVSVRRLVLIVLGLLPVLAPGAGIAAADRPPQALIEELEKLYGLPDDERKVTEEAVRIVRACVYTLKLVEAVDTNSISLTMKDEHTGLCLGVMQGLRDSFRFQQPDGFPILGVCLPKGVELSTLAIRFIDYAKRHREDLTYSPGLVAYWAATEAWPCPAAAKGSKE
jgi:hypothetical protein